MAQHFRFPSRRPRVNVESSPGFFAYSKELKASCLCFGGASFAYFRGLEKSFVFRIIRLALHASKDFWKTETEHVLVRPEKPEKRGHHYWANIRCYWGQKKGAEKTSECFVGVFLGFSATVLIDFSVTSWVLYCALLLIGQVFTFRRVEMVYCLGRFSSHAQTKYNSATVGDKKTEQANNYWAKLT